MDILLIGSQDHDLISKILRLQWIGIAFTPALYLEFARSIRLSVRENHVPVWLRFASLLVGGAVAFMALYTDLVVYDAGLVREVHQLSPGPFFYPLRCCLPWLPFGGCSRRWMPDAAVTPPRHGGA
jgi:hypothetical protein